MMTSEFAATYNAAEAQLSTLKAMAYNISIIPRREGEHDYKSLVSAQDILRNTKYMLEKNKRHFDIIITPLHKHFFYVLVDDIKDYDAFLKLGPIYAQETSTGSRQGVIKLPGDSTKEGADWEAARILVSELNQRLGDPKVASPQQPMRLAGFKNMKPERHRETVTALLIEPDASPTAILARWEELRRQQTEQQKAAVRTRAPKTKTETELPRPATPLAAAFQDALRRHRAETADRSAADYRAVYELYAAGYDAEDIKRELEAVSGRKSNPAYYANRTVNRVVQRY